MKKKVSLRVAACCLCLWQVTSADTIVLKNGEKIEGRVIRETELSYLVEIGSGVSKEDRIISKEDVKSIERDAADLVQFEKLSSFVPTPELLSVADYDKRIEQVESFLKDFPQSSKAGKAKEIHDELVRERDVVNSGGVKMGEVMLSAEEYGANAYEFDAMISEKAMKAAISKGELLTALRLFSVYDTKFGDAEGRDALVGEIKQVLLTLQNAVNNSALTFDARVEKRRAGLAQMSPQDRVRAEQAIAEQEAKLKERLDAEKLARAWVTPDEYSKESLEECKRQIEAELRRLEVAKVREPDAPSMASVYRTGWEGIVQATEEEKKAVLDELRRLKLPEEYIEKIANRGQVVQK